MGDTFIKGDPYRGSCPCDPLHFQFRRRYTLMKRCELDRGYLGLEILESFRYLPL